MDLVQQHRKTKGYSRFEKTSRSCDVKQQCEGESIYRVLKYTTDITKQDWGEFTKLADLPNLAELTFNGNPLEEKMQADGDYHEKEKFVYITDLQHELIRKG